MEQFKAWFSQLQQREQWLVGCGLPLMILMLVYAFAWEPIRTQSQQLQTKLTSERQLFTWLNVQANELLSITAPKAGNLTSIIETSLREKSLSAYTKRLFQDSQQNTVLILEGIPYLDFMKWYLGLQEQYATVLISSIIQATPSKGLVNINLVISDSVPTPS